MATALLLQTYEGVSDEEAKARADFDLRWKVALGVGLEERPFAKSTLQLFRARLILHERMQTVFRKSLEFARYTGYFRSRGIKVVLDTSYILGRGAVKDTYNLLADGIVMLSGTLAGAGSGDGQLGSPQTQEDKGAHRGAGLPTPLPAVLFAGLNPIEEALSKIKHILGKTCARTKETLIEAIARALTAVSAKDVRGFFVNRGYRTPAQQL